MSQRYACPSMGAIGRPLAQRVAAGSRYSRGFHASARRLEDQPGDSKPSMSMKDAMMAERQPRRARSINAAYQVGNLSMRRTPRPGPPGAEGAGPKIITPRTPIIRKEAGGAPGPMVRAPATLRITRDAGPPGAGPPGRRPPGGPNLRARGGGPPGAGGARGGKGAPSNRGNEAGPGNRERGGGSKADEPKMDQDTLEPNAIDQTMMQTLYRMQRNQWDRKPYTPKYAPGSFEANELIHIGRELFRGEAPPVKVWGKMERTLNIVGMHNAAATLQVRRVPDDRPYGEDETLLDMLQDVKVEKTPKATPKKIEA